VITLKKKILLFYSYRTDLSGKQSQQWILKVEKPIEFKGAPGI
jgi:hypothetical protein